MTQYPSSPRKPAEILLPDRSRRLTESLYVRAKTQDEDLTFDSSAGDDFSLPRGYKIKKREDSTNRFKNSKH